MDGKWSNLLSFVLSLVLSKERTERKFKNFDLWKFHVLAEFKLLVPHRREKYLQIYISHLHNTDTNLLWKVLLVPKKLKFIQSLPLHV